MGSCRACNDNRPWPAGDGPGQGRCAVAFLANWDRRTPNYADHHVPVNGDVHAIDVIFVEENDDEIDAGLRLKTQGFCCRTRDCRVRGIWLGRQDSNLGMAESKSPHAH